MNDLDAEFAQLAAPAPQAAPAASPQASLDAEFAALSSSAPSQTQQANPQSSWGRFALGALLETPARLASGTAATIGGGLAGLADIPLYAAGISGKSPADVVRGVENKFTYQPRTQGGQMASAAAEYLPGKYSQFSNWVGERAAENTGSPLIGTAMNTGLQAIPLLLGGRYLAPEVKPIVNAERAPGVAEATAANLKLTPEQAQSGVVGRIAQGLSGSAKVERNLSKANAPVVDQGSAAQIGARDLSPQAIADAKAPHSAAYDRAATAGSVKLQPSDFGKVKTSGTLKNATVEELRDHYSNMGDIDAKDLVADVRQLRADAGKNIRAPFAPAQNSLGFAQRAAADGLEQALDRHLQGMQNPPITMPEFKASRVKLAEIHSVEDAMEGDHVSAKELSRQQDNGVPLTGNLKAYADAYKRFDRSLQDVNKIRDSVPVNFADLLLGGAAGLATHGATHGAATAAMFARPAIRGLLSNPLYQKHAIAGQPLMGLPSYPGLMGTAPTMPLLENDQRLLR